MAKDKAKEKAAAKLLTRLELASVLACHPRSIAKFVEEGMPVAKRGRGGRASLYSEVDCLAWKQARDEVAASPGIVDVAQARARKEHWQACLAKQMHEIRARTLLPADEVEKKWTAKIAGGRALVLSSYTTASDRVFRAAITDGLPGVEREMKALAYRVLRELSDGRVKPGKAAP